MNNPAQPTTALLLDGNSYDLLFDLKAVAHAEALTGRPLLTGLAQSEVDEPEIDLVCYMLFASLRANHPEVTLRQAVAFVSRKNFREVWNAVLTAWISSLAEPDPEEHAEASNPSPDPPISNERRWLNLWSAAIYDLRLTDAEFWAMTGRQLSILLRRHKQALDREQLLVGLLASVTANFSMCRPKEPLTPADFMPSHKPKERTEDEIAEELALQFSCMAIPATGGK